MPMAASAASQRIPIPIVMRSTSARPAPMAMRIPTSRVWRDTVYQKLARTPRGPPARAQRRARSARRLPRARCARTSRERSSSPRSRVKMSRSSRAIATACRPQAPFMRASRRGRSPGTAASSWTLRSSTGGVRPASGDRASWGGPSASPASLTSASLPHEPVLPDTATHARRSAGRRSGAGWP